MVNQPYVQAAERTPAQRPALPRPWVILLVDDELDILRSYRALLESSIERVRVLTAQTGREGLELLEKERIDLVIADFKMPGMDGIEFLYQARKKSPGVPRLMFTAFATEELARRAFVESFVDSFLSKTLDPVKFVEEVRGHLHYEPGEASTTPRPVRTHEAIGQES